jgi:hypothetical protein
MGPRKGFAVSSFRIAYRRRTAAGTRRSSGCDIGPVIWLLVQGSCRLPCFVAAPGTVKSFDKNSPGSQNNNRIARLPAKPGAYCESRARNHGHSSQCTAERWMLRGELHLLGSQILVRILRQPARVRASHPVSSKIRVCGVARGSQESALGLLAPYVRSPHCNWLRGAWMAKRKSWLKTV